MDTIRRNGKRIAVDIIGVAMILCAPLLGWIPGPGGIPLLLAGLGLLSLNHEWARRAREHLMRKGNDVTHILFPDKPLVKWLYDILTVLILVAAYFMYRQDDSMLYNAAGTVATTMAVAIFLLNRKRGQWFADKFKVLVSPRPKHKN